MREQGRKLLAMALTVMVVASYTVPTFALEATSSSSAATAGQETTGEKTAGSTSESKNSGGTEASQKEASASSATEKSSDAEAGSESAKESAKESASEASKSESGESSEAIDSADSEEATGDETADADSSAETDSESDANSSGTYGDLKWSFDSEGTLEITGNGAMEDTYAAGYPWYEHADSIRKVVIGDGVTSVGNYAFYRDWSASDPSYNKLTSVSIAGSVTEIGEWAFQGCQNIKTLTLGEGLQKIGMYAFSHCESLTEVTLPSTTTSFGAHVFYSCFNLSSINIPEGTPEIVSGMFSGCSSLQQIELPSSIKAIDANSFNGAGLTSLTIPDSVTSIGLYAFSRTYSLTSLTIPGSVTSIHDEMFGDGTSDDVVIHCVCGSAAYNFAKNNSYQYETSGHTWDDGTITIEPTCGSKGEKVYTCVGCGETKTEELPALDQEHTWKSDYTVDEEPVYEDGVLKTAGTKSIHCEKCDGIKEGSEKKYAEAGALTWELDAEGTLTISGEGEIPNNPSWRKVLNYGEVKSVVINEGVTAIGNLAFYNYSKLKSVSIPSSVTAIYGAAFSGCTSLTEVELPNSLDTIGDGAFQESGIQKITLPSSLKKLGSKAFYGCVGLEEITLPASLTSYEDEILAECPSLTKVYAKAKEITFGSDVFKNSITNLTIYCACYSSAKTYAQENLIAVVADHQLQSEYTVDVEPEFTQKYATAWELKTCGVKTRHCELCGASDESTAIKFAPVIQGESVNWEFKDGTLTISGTGGSIDNPSWNDDATGIKNSDIEKVVIESGVTTINSFAFFYCSNLKSVSIADSVTRIGHAAFQGCTSLTEVDLPDSLTSIGACAFWRCSNLTSVEIPDSVTEIGEEAFEECSALSNVTLPKNLTTIGNKAFDNCESLQEVIIPDGVTSIGEQAFNACGKIQSITIPESVTSVGDKAFSNCGSLTDVTVLSKDVEFGGNNVFADCGSNLTVHLDCDNSKVKTYAEENNLTVEISHQWNDGEVTKKETCTDAGEKTYTCARCGETKTEEIPSYGKEHQWNANAILQYLEFDEDTGEMTQPQIRATQCATCGAIDELTREVHGIDDNVTWFWNQNTKNLFVNDNVASGTADMPDDPNWRDFVNYNTDVTSVTLSNNIRKIGKNAFSRFNNLTSVSIYKNSVMEEIGENAFYCCSALTSINLPSGLKKIGKNAFTDTAITSLDLPNGLTEINDQAFHDCMKLTEVTIPATVTSIGQEAFFACTDLKKVTINANALTIGKNAFKHCHKDLVIYCECDSDAVEYAKENQLNYEVTHDWGKDYNVETEPVYEDGKLITAGVGVRQCTDCGEIDESSRAKFGTDGDIAWEFNLESGTLTISGEGEMPDNGNWNDFVDRTAVKRVVVDTGITSVARNAFNQYRNLTAVRLPETVTTIGNDAFYYCNSLTEITLPSSLTEIGKEAFIYSGLTKIELPESLRTIGEAAFQATKLQTVDIPEGVETIEADVFRGNTSLTEVTIPSTVKTIGDGVFNACSKLEKVTVGTYDVTFGADIFKNCNEDMVLAYACDNTVVSKYATENSLQTELSHFWDDGEITTEPTCTDAGVRTYNCKKCNATKAEEVPALGGDHEWETEYTIDKEPTASEPGVKSIHCKKCPAKKDEIKYTAAGTYNDMDWELDEDGTLTLKSSGDASFPTYDAENAPWYTYRYQVTKLIIQMDTPSAVTIEDGFFKSYTSLTSLEILGNVGTIEEDAFSECTKLAEVTIGDGVTTIEKWAFNGDSALKKVTVEGTSLQTVEERAFQDCNANLTFYCECCTTAIVNYAADGHYACEVSHAWNEEYTVEKKATCTEAGSESLYCSREGCGEKKDTREIPALGGDHEWEENYTIDKQPTDTEEGSKSIHCSKCDATKDAVAIIACGEDADGLTWDLDADGTLTIIGSGNAKLSAYHASGAPWKSYKDAVRSLDIRMNTTGSDVVNASLFEGYTNLEKVSISGSITQLSDYAFRNCAKLKEVSITSSLQSVGNAAFQHCTGLEEISLPDSVTAIGMSAFHDCTSLTEITLPAKLTGLGSSVFYGCTALKEIVIPQNVLKVQEYTFLDCKSLEKVTISSDVTAIEQAAFMRCTSLTEVTIPASVTSIASEAFYSDSALARVTVLGTGLESIADNAFSNCSGSLVMVHDCANAVAADYATAHNLTTELTHEWNTDYTTDKKATCVEPGVESIHCKNCDTIKEGSEREISTIGGEHEWETEPTVDKEATCMEKGSQSIHCKNCGASDPDTVEEIPMKDHEYSDEYTVDKAATCTESGSKSKHCKTEGCDAYDPDSVTTIDPLGHEYAEEYTVDVESTCTEAGSESRHCTREGCDATIDSRATELKSHSWGNAKVKTSPTCTTEGLVELTCTCGATKDTVIAALGHNWDDGTIKVQPTCSSKGRIVFECKRCGEVRTQSIDMIDHDWTEGTVTTEPTCTTKGVMTYACRACSTTKTESIDALGHDYVDNGVLKEATCTESGWRSEKCTRCGAKENYVIEAKGHSYSDTYTVDKEATCTEAGSQSKHCTECGAIDESSVQEIKATGHNYSDTYTVDKEATCTEAGSQSKHCTECGAIDESSVQEIKATGHSWDDGVVTTEPTCTETGVKTYTCTVCDETKTESIAKTAHQYLAWETIKKATCTEKGWKKEVCSVCGNVNLEVIPATGHTWKHYKKSAGYLKNGTEYDYCTICKVKKNVKILRGYAKYVVKSFKVSKGTKSFTAKWKKASKSNQKKMTGYQIRYSTKSNMSGAKYVTAKKTSKSKKIKKLSRKKTYYVQVRTYMKKNGVTYYSSWSSRKSVKTK